MAREIVTAKKTEYGEYLALKKESIKNIEKLSKEKLRISEHEIKKRFIDATKSRKDKILFLKINQKIIGLLDISFMRLNGFKTAYLNQIVISKSHKRKGHGRYLMKVFIDISRKKKVEKIRFGVKVENKPAIKLYKKLGFELKAYRFEMKIR